MCGIAGAVNFDIEFINSVKNELLAIQNHRGPDASGFSQYNNTFLFHNRLSIIDLSAQSNQPFISACGNYVIVYNGEVYNYKQLAQELTAGGFQLRTSSDTEVVLEMFVRHGSSIVEKLSGMYAFAIYHIPSGQIWLFRDRIGIKPLFYYYHEQKFAFSSELKFLKKLLNNNLTLNYNALGQFLHVGYVPAPSTAFNEVHKVEAAGCIHFNKNEISSSVFYPISRNLSTEVYSDYRDNFEKLNYLLSESVKKHLISDVPVGVFLSGGIDSSLLTAIAAKHSTETLNTFTVGTTVKEFDETAYARKIALHLGTNHTELIVSPEEAMKALNTALLIYDEPFADSSSIPTLLVSQLASKKVKVCLSGEGSDELFGGYGAYKWAWRIDAPFMPYFRKTVARTLSFSSGPRYKKAAAILNYDNRTFLPSHIFSHEQNLFSLNEISKLLNYEPWSENQVNRIHQLRLIRKLSLFEDQSFYDLTCYLPDDLLVKVDRASMKCSLEVRVPYLDNDVVKFAVNLINNQKLKGKTHKYLLKEVLYKWLPKNFFDRPKKGFSIPLAEWLGKEMSYLIEENLSDEVIKKHNVIQNLNEVHNLIARFKSGEKHLYNRIWSLIVLHRWLSHNAT
jgi:asparagine synthase (glutamine-hydrolysing)